MDADRKARDVIKSNGRIVYEHGFRALVAAVLTIALAVAGLAVWPGFFLVALCFAVIAGWHIGGVIASS